MNDKEASGLSSATKRERRVLIGWIGGFTMVLVVLLLLLAKFTLNHFDGMNTELKEIGGTHVQLMRMVTNAENYQLEQHLYLERIFRHTAAGDDQAQEKIRDYLVAFEVFNNQFHDELRKGLRQIEGLQVITGDMRNRKESIRVQLNKLLKEHQYFNTDAEEMIAFLTTGQYEEAENRFHQIEEDVQTVSHNAQRLSRDLEDFIAESVRATEFHASSAISNTKYFTFGAATVAIAYGIFVIIFMLRYFNGLKKVETELRKQEPDPLTFQFFLQG